MTALVRHRGPDSEGYLVWDEAGRALPFGGEDTPRDVYEAALAARPDRTTPAPRLPVIAALGHRRLSILDLSPAGHQPMAIGDGQHVIIFNGEIYNHEDIRAELRRLGHRFVSRTDTEVVLHAYREWGAACLHRFNGMFALLIYMPRTRRVFIARDRFGVKPCYLWTSPDGFVAVASEIKQFTALPGWTARLDAQRAYHYLNYGLTDHGRETMFAGVEQLLGGEYFEGTVATLAEPSRILTRWYDLAPEPRRVSAADAAQGFRDLFIDSVRLRLQADVPVGTLLSGGLDSSSIACVASRLIGTGTRQNSFTARAEDSRLDEGPHVQRVLDQTGATPHHTVPTLQGFLDAMPAMVWHHDEPFGNASIFAEWEVYRLAKQTATRVALDGHGADELLGGYHVFFGAMLSRLVRKGQGLRFTREVAALRKAHDYGWGYAATRIADAFLPDWANAAARRFSGHMMPAAEWMETRALGIDADDLPARLGTRAHSTRDLSLSMLRASSLPVQLHWSDRDSMAHGVESRSPFLDYRLVEFALACPEESRVGGGTTKRLQRDAMVGILPEAIRQRADKMGFETAEERWIRRDRPQLFLDLSAAAVARAEGVLNAKALARAERIILTNTPFDRFIWRLILFSTWLERFQVAT